MSSSEGYLIKKILLLLVIFGISSLFYYIKKDSSLDSIPSFSQRNTPIDWASSVKIGIIGDSWVAEKKIDKAIHETMQSFGINSEVISSGHGGAKSRQILRDLLLDDSKPYSSHKLLMDDDLDYFIIIGGVNDTAGHIGSKFYSHHILQIIKIAQLRGFYPIVVEVPEYGIEYDSGNILSVSKHMIYRLLFDGMNTDVIFDYREELKKSIPTSIMDQMTLIPFDPFIKDYHENKNLYANPSHLNKEGWQKLGSYIAKEIVKIHNNRINSDK